MSSQFKVNIKWGKELYKDVELDTHEPPIIFKAQLFALTNVQPERQKIMFKGSTLNDETWSNFEKNLKDGVVLMMMGSVDALPQAPVQQTKFIEDLNDSQLAYALDMPVGLKNLGRFGFFFLPVMSTYQTINLIPMSRQHVLFECRCAVFQSRARTVCRLTVIQAEAHSGTQRRHG
jgi:hypothetical protein